MTMSQTRRALLGGMLSFPLARAAQAEGLAPPTGRVILDVAATAEGVVTLTNAPGVARFDQAMLETLPQSGFSTASPWLDKPARFDGVSGQDLFAVLGTRGREVVAAALNDYRVTIPIEDFSEGGLLIAHRIDGKPIPVRARGPLWIVYPFDAHQRFRSELYYSRSIWQLRSLTLRG